MFQLNSLNLIPWYSVDIQYYLAIKSSCFTLVESLTLKKKNFLFATSKKNHGKTWISNVVKYSEIVNE